jgi:hypothetical protein
MHSSYIARVAATRLVYIKIPQRFFPIFLKEVAVGKGRKSGEGNSWLPFFKDTIRDMSDEMGERPYMEGAIYMKS